MRDSKLVETYIHLLPGFIFVAEPLIGFIPALSEMVTDR